MAVKVVASIKVEFDDKNRAKFDIDTNEDQQILTAIMGLEGFLSSRTGLDVGEIREIIDEHKKEVNVKPVKKK